ncbi:Com family DNA-binding transcriptional regulator [Vibrio parahaemolyticus]|nr:Com family DNA-binding transcriptional regulator [Vibrio parahaemolyticus]EJG0221690.1 Com family DNA-binding transcriptional regulator [Vibrio parahaemolyticus]EJG0231817.1 Com family DNA-binding transcriptional regulator [Vibrio parahaemolyticus]EJG0250862.1 Com family DNA-binding transcriptional regulator [Vibrio parahaemolyticus]EJG0388827.1 Com family DNA-binding transcriptional regulator [Vibrio parahaemolyticus]
MTLLKELRCPNCGKLLCKHDGPVQIKCGRCKKMVEK